MRFAFLLVGLSFAVATQAATLGTLTLPPDAQGPRHALLPTNAAGQAELRGDLTVNLAPDARYPRQAMAG